MDSPVPVRPAGNGPEGETGTTVRYQKTGGFLKPEGALIPPPKDAVQHRMGVEVHMTNHIANDTKTTGGAIYTWQSHFYRSACAVSLSVNKVVIRPLFKAARRMRALWGP